MWWTAAVFALNYLVVDIEIMSELFPACLLELLCHLACNYETKKKKTIIALFFDEVHIKMDLQKQCTSCEALMPNDGHTFGLIWHCESQMKDLKHRSAALPRRFLLSYHLSVHIYLSMQMELMLCLGCFLWCLTSPASYRCVYEAKRSRPQQKAKRLGCV